MSLNRCSKSPRYFVPATRRRGHLELNDAFTQYGFRGVALGDPARKAFDNRRLSHARVAQQDRTVFGEVAENAGELEHLLAPADGRVDYPVAGLLREVFAERVQERRRLAGPPRLGDSQALVTS